MHERIKQLALQASEKHDYNPEFAQKFAELIVRECAELFADDLDSMDGYTGRACRNMIKQYFGVE